ncbi:MAG: lysylphosphatidylglycerol synthase domain-containing protein [Streptosporangiaceae bacterium]
MVAAGRNRWTLTAADATCLVLAIKAIGAAVPWHRVLLVWSAGIGAGSFSPTPGGIGIVEAAMIAVLVVAGLRPPEAVAAVLIYRLVNAKSVITMVFFVYRSIRQRHERSAA